MYLTLPIVAGFTQLMAGKEKLPLDVPTFKTELLPMHAMTSDQTARLLRQYTDVDEDNLMENGSLRSSKKWSDSKIWKDCSGVLAVLFKLSLFTLSVACIQALQGSMPYFELTLLRYIAQVILMVLWFFSRKSFPMVEKRLAIYVFFGCVFSNTYNISFSIAATYLPTGTLGAVFRTLCLLFGAFFSKFVAKEMVGKIHFFAMFMHVLGALCLLEPSFLFSKIKPESHFNIMDERYTLGPCDNDPELYLLSNNSNLTTDVRQDTEFKRRTHNEIIGFVLTFVAALTLSIFQALTKMKLSEVTPAAQSFWNGITGTIASATLMLAAEDPILPRHFLCISYVIGYAAGMAGACVALTCSLRLISTIVSALLDPVQLVLLFMVQYTVLENIQPGHRNWLEVLGASLIVIGGIVPVVHALRKNSQQDDHTEFDKLSVDSDQDYSDDEYNFFKSY